MYYSDASVYDNGGGDYYIDYNKDGYYVVVQAGQIITDASKLRPNPQPAPEPRTYEFTAKHNPIGGWGTHMHLDNDTVQLLLEEAITGDGRKQLYGYYDGKVYEFQPDNVSTYHGYPIPGEQAPTSVLRQWRAEGRMTQAEYNRLRNQGDLHER